MSRIASAIIALSAVATGHAGAQASPPIKRWDIGADFGVQASPSSDVTRGLNAPVSIRYGAVNSQYRLTIDQRLTLGDRRIRGGTAPIAIEAALGWRLGSNAHVHRTVLGPYTFVGFNLTGPHRYNRNDEGVRRGYYGLSGGVGTRIALFQMVLRPELVVGHDFGGGARGSMYRVPERTRIAVRLGYGYHFTSGKN